MNRTKPEITLDSRLPNSGITLNGILDTFMQKQPLYILPHS